jgi:hypothetical protein
MSFQGEKYEKRTRKEGENLKEKKGRKKKDKREVEVQRVK